MKASKKTKNRIAKEGSSQYKTVAHFLYKWLTYSMAPSSQEREWSKSLASSVSLHMSRYCWPEARELNKQWKKVLKLQEQYVKSEKQGLSTDILIPLHRKVTRLTHSLIYSFLGMHNKLRGSGRRVEGEWSTPASKSKMMKAIGISSYKKFNAFAHMHGIKQAGNRKLWQIRIDSMDRTTRSKLEKLG